MTLRDELRERLLAPGKGLGIALRAVPSAVRENAIQQIIELIASREAAAVERCATVCDQIAQNWRDGAEYRKSRHENGMAKDFGNIADGAKACAAAIRKGQGR
jgi:hypothetical protein